MIYGGKIIVLFQEYDRVIIFRGIISSLWDAVMIKQQKSKI